MASAKCYVYDGEFKAVRGRGAASTGGPMDASTRASARRPSKEGRGVIPPGRWQRLRRLLLPEPWWE